MTKLEELATLGQSIWYDFIRRDILLNGELQRLIDMGLRGMTSNPSIFEKAINGSDIYDEDFNKLVAEGKTPKEIYEEIALKDISIAADLFMPVFENTHRIDGYVSIEVDPNLAHDTEGTIAEGKRLFQKLNKPNVMIKVPATKEGLPAVTELIASGINVNVTLIFNIDNYLEVVQSFKDGITKLDERKGTLCCVESVASFFVSRLDTYVDKILDEKGRPELKGKTAIAYAKTVYQEFLKIFSGDEWQKLIDKGARTQQLLWASTSTKNPDYPDTMYIDNLIGHNTINTVPPATLEKFLDHGVVRKTIYENLEESKEHLRKIAEAGIDLNEVTNQLQVDGVKAFADSYQKILESIQAKIEQTKVS